MNGDGREDLAVMANGKVWIYYNPLGAREDTFRRGDASGDGKVELTDAVVALGYLFLGEPKRLACEDAADADDDGTLGLADAVTLLGYLFLGSPEQLPFPGRFCGLDPTDPKPCAYTMCK